MSASKVLTGVSAWMHSPSQPAVQVPTFDLPQSLTQMGNYLSQIQTIIAILAGIVAVITIIVTIIGIIFAYLGFRAQREAQQEIARFRQETKKELAEGHAETKMEVADRHRRHEDEIRLLTKAELGQLRSTLIDELDERIEDIERSFTQELVHKIETIETSYASNLQRIENIIAAFEREYSEDDDRKLLVSDFIRYNRFRLLLMHLFSGDRKVMQEGLSLLLAEYIPNIQVFTGSRLRDLLVELRKSGRFSRSDLRILADEVITTLDGRFPRANVA